MKSDKYINLFWFDLPGTSYEEFWRWLSGHVQFAVIKWLRDEFHQNGIHIDFELWAGIGDQVRLVKHCQALISKGIKCIWIVI